MMHVGTWAPSFCKGVFTEFRDIDIAVVAPLAEFAARQRTMAERRAQVRQSSPTDADEPREA